MSASGSERSHTITVWYSSGERSDKQVLYNPGCSFVDTMKLWCDATDTHFDDNQFTLFNTQDAIPEVLTGDMGNFDVFLHNKDTSVQFSYTDDDTVIQSIDSANETIAAVFQILIDETGLDPAGVRLAVRRHGTLSARELAREQQRADGVAHVRLVRVSALERRHEQVAALMAATQESLNGKRKIDELELDHVAVQKTCVEQHKTNHSRVKALELELQAAKAERAAFTKQSPKLIAESSAAVEAAKATHQANETKREALDSAFVRQNKCVVCFDPNAGSDILQPCGHMVACRKCADKLAGKRCPVCRADVLSVQRVYHC
jgi:hypothetical protein